MNRLAIWVAQTAMGAKAPMAPAQAMASPLTAIVQPPPGLSTSSQGGRSMLPLFVTKTVLFRCRSARGIDKSSWVQAVGPSRAAERGSQA
jgi:hypothetical protein